jgi:transposase
LRTAFSKELETFDKDKIVWIDESGMNRRLSRENVKCKKGQEIDIEIFGSRIPRVSVVAGMKESDNKLVGAYRYEGTANRTFFTEWLTTELLPELEAGSILILDNCSIHKSQEITKLVEDANMVIRFLPPRSPDLNPIEHKWQQKKQLIKKCDHLNSLTEDEYLELFDQTLIAMSS